MTWIVSDKGRYWVDPPAPRKKRAYPKSAKFADIKVGDWLEGGPYARFLANSSERKAAPIFTLVTDHWFDPVAGQTNSEQGMMFAVAQLRGIDRETGEPRFHEKRGHTRRGLASQAYFPSKVADPVAVLRATMQGVQDGSVTLLSRAKRAPRSRPIGLL